jgi:hypothetical protein
MNESHKVDDGQDGQPNLMFPVAGGEASPLASDPAFDSESLRFDRQEVPEGDVVDTNWDIPTIEFSARHPQQHQPLINEVPLPPTFPPVRAASRVTSTGEAATNDSVWDTRLDLDPSEDDEVQAVAPLFQATTSPAVEEQQQVMSAVDSTLASDHTSVEEDNEFLRIITGAEQPDERSVERKPQRTTRRRTPRSHTTSRESTGKGVLWYIAGGALSGIVVVAVVIIVTSLMH